MGGPQAGPPIVVVWVQDAFHVIVPIDLSLVFAGWVPSPAPRTRGKEAITGRTEDRLPREIAETAG